MKLYKATITPKSNFATPLKGDTIFGQLCWVIRYVYGNDKLDELLSDYSSTPFMIVSDAFVNNYLPKPSLPSFLLGEDGDKKKENRKKTWLNIDDLQNGNFTNAKRSDEIGYKVKKESIVKNSINYKSFKTGAEGFDPYAEDEIGLSSSLDIYFCLNETIFNLENLKDSLKILGEMGYGKNATIGKGRFEVEDVKEIKFKKRASTTFMTLSPLSLQNIKAKEIYYTVFTRFGKHGGDLANSSPFKKPILLADTSAVLLFDEEKELDFVGSAITSHSKHTETIHQGYSILLPIKEISNE